MKSRITMEPMQAQSISPYLRDAIESVVDNHIDTQEPSETAVEKLSRLVELAVRNDEGAIEKLRRFVSGEIAIVFEDIDDLRARVKNVLDKLPELQAKYSSPPNA